MFSLALLYYTDRFLTSFISGFSLGSDRRAKMEEAEVVSEEADPDEEVIREDTAEEGDAW